MQCQRCLPLGATAAKQSPASPKGPGFVARTRGKQPSDRSGRCLRALVRLGFRRFVFRARGDNVMCTCNLLVSYKYPLLPARTHAASLSHVTASHEPRAAPLTSKLAARGTDPLPEAPRAWRSLKHPGCKEISNRRQISFAGAKEGPEPPLRPAKAFGWAARGPLPRNPRPRRARVLGTPSARRFGGRGALWTHTSLIKDARALGRVSNVSPLADKHAHEYSCATNKTLNSLTTSNHGQERFASAPKNTVCRLRPRVRGQHR